MSSESMDCLSWHWQPQQDRLQWQGEATRLPCPASMSGLLQAVTTEPSRARLGRKLQQCLRADQPFSQLVRLTAAGDRSPLICHLAATKEQQQLRGILLDLTDQPIPGLQKAALDILFNRTDRAYWIMTPDRRTLLCNRALERLSGLNRVDLLGSEVLERLATGLDPSAQAQIWQTLADAGQWHGELALTGQPAPLALSLYTLAERQGYLATLIPPATAPRQAQRQQAWHDPVTGLQQRELFLQLARHEIARHQHNGHQLAMLVLKLDHWDKVEASLPAQYSKQLLQLTAKRLQGCAPDSASCAVISTNTFALLLGNITRPEQIDQQVQALFDAFGAPYELTEEPLYLTCSIGISVLQVDAANAERMLTHATQAMYTQGLAGSNSAAYFNSELEQQSNRQLLLMQALQKALREDTLAIRYRPIISCQSGQVVKLAAMAAAPDLEAQFHCPPQALPAVAQAYGFLPALEDWVSQRVCEEINQFQLQEHTTLKFSLSHSLQHSQDLSQLVTRLAKAGITPDKIELAISGFSLPAQREQAQNWIAEARELGLAVVLDHFGSTEVALSSLLSLPVQGVHIDRRLVSGCDRDARLAALLHGILSSCQLSNIEVTATGVQQPDEAIHLQRMGCNLLQGDLFAPPLSLLELVERMKGWSKQPPLTPIRADQGTAHEVMDSRLIRLRMDERLRVLWQRQDEGVAVILDEDNALVGVIRQTELQRATSPQLGTAAESSREQKQWDRPLHQIMKREWVELRADTPLVDVRQQFIQQQLDWVVVVNEHRYPLGIIHAWKLLAQALS